MGANNADFGTGIIRGRDASGAPALSTKFDGPAALHITSEPNQFAAHFDKPIAFGGTD